MIFFTFPPVDQMDLQYFQTYQWIFVLMNNEVRHNVCEIFIEDKRNFLVTVYDDLI